MRPTYGFGPYVLDVNERRLTRGGAPCEVQGKVLDLLAALLERPGRLWEREALQARLWPGVFVSEDALFQVIRKARRALDDAPDAPRWIETVAGKGYRFIGQLAPPELTPAVVPPPPTGGRPPARPLPPATSFTGREGLLAPLVVELLAHGGVWTLTGPGGVGKTRLALELIERVLTTFTSVPVFCALDACTERAGIRTAIGRAIGLAAHALDQPDEIIEELRARGDVVVVLDNAEHVVEALAVEIARWPAALPNARIVVTSRVRLGLGAERLVDVPPLALPPLDADLTGLAAFGASRLLLERAGTAAGYRPTEADAGALAALAERLGGLPLALELVAPRLRLLSPAQLHGRLGHLLDVGVGRAADRPSRHLTLRSAIATSWELLDDVDRRALSDLSVFAGPFSLEAAEAVIAVEPDPLEVLERLVDHSLVRRGEGPAPLQLLPSLREFAAEHATATAARDRMTAWYARDDAFPGPEHQAARQAQAERASLVVALDHAVEREDGPAAAGVALNLCRTLLAHGPLREAGERLPRVRALPGVPPAARATLALREAEARVDGGAVEEASALLDAAAPLVADDPAGRAALAWTRMGVLHRRGSVEDALTLADATLADPSLSQEDRARFLLGRARAMVLVHGHSDAANAALRACLDLAVALGLPAVRASALYELGLNLLLAGDLRGSRECLEQALECARAVADLVTEAKARARLGRVLVRLGEIDAAEVHLAAAARACRQTGVVESQGVCAESLGIIALQRGDYEAALARYREAVAFHGLSGHTHLHAVVRGNLGTLLAQMGRYDEARVELTVALEQHRARGRSPGHVLGTLGLIDTRLGDIDSARLHLGAAVHAHDADGNRRSAARGRAGLAAVELDAGNFDEAERLVQESVRVLRACEDRDGLGQALGIAGWIAGIAGRPHEHVFDEAEAMLGDAGLVGSLAIVRCARAWVAVRSGDRARALALRAASIDATGQIGPELAWYLARLDRELAAAPK